MANRYFERADHAEAYVKFRHQPPASLINHVISFLKEEYAGSMEKAVDVGCGSGQGTQVLTPYFESIYGLDVSDSQISEAIRSTKSNTVTFKISPAETLPFSSNSVQLVIAGQAAHWFDIKVFYKEVDRILVPGGVVALYGYHLPRPVHESLSDKLFDLVEHMYFKETGAYWASGIRDVDDSYGGEKYIMPYKDFVRDASHYKDRTMTVADFAGLVSTWSGFQNFRAANGDIAAQNILEKFQNGFMQILNVPTAPEDTNVCIRFPYFLLMGRKPLS